MYTYDHCNLSNPLHRMKLSVCLCSEFYLSFLRKRFHRLQIAVIVSKMNRSISSRDNTLMPVNRLSQPPMSVKNLLAGYAGTSVILLYLLCSVILCVCTGEVFKS